MHTQADASGPEERIVAAIRRYLVDRPGAADSLQGITQWWLADLDPPPAADAVRAALEWLAARGVVEQLGVVGTGGLWRAAGGRRCNTAAD